MIEKLAAGKTDATKTLDDYENMYRKTCKTFTHPKEKRLCWYLGGAADSATNILREVSRPMSMGVPPLQICRRLKGKDASICSLRYTGSSVMEPTLESGKKAAAPVKIDWSNIRKKRVKELRKILEQWGEECNGCAEKGDFIRRLEELRPKYDKKSEL